MIRLSMSHSVRSIHVRLHLPLEETREAFIVCQKHTV